jgi:adenosylmethionine-8-amino-7-oxononanoate aminotransferase
MGPWVILGTDTDAGKTTLASLLLAAFPDRLRYWKPVETGPSDTQRLRMLVPTATIYQPVARFQTPVAPPLAAAREGRQVPGPEELLSRLPQPPTDLLIETFGSPFSPLTNDHLQIEFIGRLPAGRIVVTPSTVGAIGRSLQTCYSLAQWGLAPHVVVLLGPDDPYAENELRRRLARTTIHSVQAPVSWDESGLRAAALAQTSVLEAILRDADTERPPSTIFMTGLAPHGETEDIVGLDHQYVWHPYTPLKAPDPVVVIRAEAEFLELADGRRVIDGISSWWSILHGHRHPPLVAALKAALDRLDHVHFAGIAHPDGARLGAALVGSVFPNGKGKVFFSDNGSTAVEVALKMAYHYWRLQGQERRSLFVGFENAYHGDTLGAMSVSRDPVFFGRFEPLLAPAQILPLDPDRLDDFLRKHPNQVAAVIVEPLIQAAGGMRMHEPSVLRQLWEVTRQHESLFIVDEVFTGCGRTGWLWAHQAAQVEPDLVCVGKTLAGGLLPLAATLVSERVVRPFDGTDPEQTFYHGHTFTAHPLACAVAVANWQLLQHSGLAAPRRLERFFRERLMPLDHRPGIRQVRVLGGVAAVELDWPGGYWAQIRQRLFEESLKCGVLMRPLGPVLYTVPPWCCSQESLERIASAMEHAVSAALGWDQ